MTRVGWIGLGAMGAPMAACVARAGHDRPAPTTSTPAVPRRCRRRREGRDLDPRSGQRGGRARPHGRHARPGRGRALRRRPGGRALCPGAAVVIMATVGPAPVRRWAERLARQLVELVDAPVSGGSPALPAGTC